ncbi:MAG: GGDEF domain-containing protein [Magnetospirillum sp.]|nr:GGDEF domain-containing protein [Magnetospirillum sp.]
MGLDTKTVWMALAVSNLLFGLLALVYTRPGPEGQTLRVWAFGQLLRGIGIVLIILKAGLPPYLGGSGNSLYLLGGSLELAAFLAYAGYGHWRRAVFYLLAGLLAAYNMAVVNVGHGVEARHLAVLFTSSLFIFSSLSALALGCSRRNRSAIQMLLIGSNVLIALTALSRAIVAGISVEWDPQSTALANQLLFVAGYVFSLSDGFGFLLLVKEDSDRDLLRMATIDDLTGLSNRASFLKLAEDRRRLCQRTGQPAAIIMMDVDHFKRINDQCGHAAGDQVLQVLGRVIREQLRDVDVCGRLGGEEFAAILPGADLAAALPVAERLRATLATTVISAGGHEIRATLSLGVADFSTENRLEHVMSVADALLYRAKAEGRDRVIPSPIRTGASEFAALY